MAGITKNFVVKNGLEVNGGLLIANTDDNKVGVGTTVLNYDFNVKGGIGVTDAVVTGIATIFDLQSTFSQVGVSTASDYYVSSTKVFETTSGLVSLSGIQTVDSTAKSTLDTILFSNQTDVNNLNISGVATFSNFADFNGIVDVSGQSQLADLHVAGLSTFVGISTHSSTIFGTDVSLTGSATLSSIEASSSVIVGSAVTINSDGIDAVGIATLSRFVNITNVDQGGGLFAGIITATNGGQPVIYFGDGSNLTGVAALPNLGISTASGFIGAGVTLLNFLGSGISTAVTNFTSGIATIFIEKGSVPGGSTGQIQFNSEGALDGSTNLTFDGTAVGVGTIVLNGSGISAGIITGTSFSGSGSGITGLTNSNLSGSAGITTANLAEFTISGVNLGGTLPTLEINTSGNGITGSQTYNGTNGATATITSNGTAANTANSLVFRDAQRSFFAGIITASTFSGTLNGNINSTGISTFSSVIVGSATTITGGGVNAVGVVSATSYTTKGTGSYQIGGVDVINSSREVEKVILDNYSEKLNAFGNTGSAPTLNIADGNFITATLSANATFAFSLGSGVTSDAISFTLHLTNDGTAGRTITWPASVKWPNGSVPVRTTTANRTDVYTFYTFNGGSTWYGNLSIYNYS